MILVTGATGANGRELIKLLSAAGEMIRDPRRSVPVALRWVEVVSADFDETQSIRRILWLLTAPIPRSASSSGN